MHQIQKLQAVFFFFFLVGWGIKPRASHTKQHCTVISTQPPPLHWLKFLFALKRAICECMLQHLHTCLGYGEYSLFFGGVPVPCRPIIIFPFPHHLPFNTWYLISHVHSWHPCPHKSAAKKAISFLSALLLIIFQGQQRVQSQPLLCGCQTEHLTYASLWKCTLAIQRLNLLMICVCW